MTEASEDQSSRDHLREFTDRAFSEFFRLWFTPEFERRRTAGQIPPDFELRSAQVLLPGEGEVIVRFNDEVRGTAMVRAQLDVEKGDQDRTSGFEGLYSFELPDDELNYGHATVFRCSSGWAGAFNFLRGRGRVYATIDRAERFYLSARSAQEAGWIDVVIDNLFSCCELLSKSATILHALQGSDSKTHDQAFLSIEKWKSLGNIEPRFVDLFSTLSRLRPIARYGSGSEESLDLPAGSMETVAEQIETLRAIASPNASEA